MDIARPASVIRQKKIRRVIVAVVGIIVVALVTVVLAQLKPAAPTVERGTTWRETVKRGEMIRQTRGPGTLVPEDIRWITSSTDATVQRIVTLPSAKILTPDTVILELRDETVQQALVDAELQLRAAQADLTSLKVRLNNELLQQQSDAANIRGQFHQAKIQAEANEQLSKEGLLSKVTTRVSQVSARGAREAECARGGAAANQGGIHHRADERRASPCRPAPGAVRPEAQPGRRAQGARRHRWRAAGRPVQVGQRVPAGTNLARIAVPGRLKAELRIPETQARDIEIGQMATVDTRNGEVTRAASRVSTRPPRTAPSSWMSRLPILCPAGARPDLSVDGTVELERLNDVLNVGRPAFGQEESTISLFKVTAGTCEQPEEAVRTTVKLGRSSVNTVEILSGLNKGDCVILSDMSAWDGRDRVLLQ